MVSKKTLNEHITNNKRMSKEVRKQHNQSLQTRAHFHLWDELKTIMDMNHMLNIAKCDTLEEQEQYLNDIGALFKQRVSSHKIPMYVINKSKAYVALCQFTKYDVYSYKYGSSIKLRISQVTTCAARKTSSKRSHTKNIISLKRELTCVKTALPEKNAQPSEWEWVDTKYDKNSKSWVPTDKWTLEPDPKTGRRTQTSASSLATEHRLQSWTLEPDS